MKKNKISSMIFLMLFIFVIKINAMNVWTIGDEVRISPETGKAFEDNASIQPSGLTGDYKTSNYIWNKATNTVTVYGAKNEVIAFQLIIERENSEIINGVNVTIDDLLGTNGKIAKDNIELFKEWYVYIKKTDSTDYNVSILNAGWYPEPLIPFATSKGAPFDLPANDYYYMSSEGGGQKLTNHQNQAVWVDIYIPKNTGNDEYKGTIHITSNTGQSKDINLVVKVWDFMLSDQTHGGEEFMTTSASMEEYQLAHQHRITIGNYRNTISWDTATNKVNWNIYMSDTSINKKIITGTGFIKGLGAGVPVRHFMLPFDVKMDRIKGEGPIGGKTFPTVGISGDWPVDQPFPDTYKNCAKSLMQDICQYFETNFPAVELTNWPNGFDEPYFQKNADYGTAYLRNLAARMKDFGQIFEDAVGDKIKYRIDIGSGFGSCNTDLNNDSKIESPACKEVINFFQNGNKNVVDIWDVGPKNMNTKALRDAKVNTIYVYNGREPKTGGEAINVPGISFRVSQWIMWKYGVTVLATWTYKSKYDGFRRVYYGEGYLSDAAAGIWHLMYDGAYIGLPSNVKIAGIRMKEIRRGLQDYEYLWLLKQKGQEAVANSLANTMVVKGFEDISLWTRGAWKQHPQDWFNAVKQMGETLTTAIDKSAFDLKKSKISSYPNPFNPECYISISGQLSAVSKIKIYNILGQTVRELNVNNGSNSVYWDGRDNFGKELSSGMYFYEMLANNKVQSCRKMLMLK